MTLLINSLCLILCSSCAVFTANNSDTSDLDALTLDKLRIIRLNLDSGKPRHAWAELGPLVLEYPENSKILNMAGLNFLAMSEPKRALQYFRRAYKIQPTTAIGLNLSSALISMGEYKTARRVVMRLLKKTDPYLYPERLWHNLALINEKDKKIDAAIDNYLKAIELNPNYYMSIIALARIFKGKNLPAKAQHYYQLAKQVCENCFEPQGEIATYMINSGRPEEAITLLRHYLARQKEDESDRKEAEDLLSLAQRIKERQQR